MLNLDFMLPGVLLLNFIKVSPGTEAHACEIYASASI